MKLSVFYVTYDGVTSYYCGIGALTQYFLAAAPQLRAALQRNGVETDVHVVAPALPAGTDWHVPEISSRSELLAAEAGVSLHEVSAPPKGLNPFGAVGWWPSLCSEVLELVTGLIPAESHAIVLANDTPFAGIATALAATDDPGALTLVWLAHSTGRLWAHADHYPPEADRIAWEQGAVDSAAGSKGVYVGATSHFMAGHLVDHYGASPDALSDFRAGVDASYLDRFFEKPGPLGGRLREVLDLAGGRPLLLCFGRAAWYKGLPEAGEIAARVAETGLMYPVICASDYGTADSHRTLELLKERFANGRAGLLLADESFDLPKYLLQLSEVRVVLVPSLRDNLASVVSEARILNAGHTVVVVSDVGGLSEQVDHGRDGFLCDVSDAATVADLCVDLAQRSDEEIAELAKTGRQRVAQDFDLGRNLARSILAMPTVRAMME